VARATHASDRGDRRDDIESVGKWRFDRSGKYPVNKNAEDFCRATRVIPGRRAAYGAQLRS
jgi:hypothetical protein